MKKILSEENRFAEGEPPWVKIGSKGRIDEIASENSNHPGQGSKPPNRSAMPAPNAIAKTAPLVIADPSTQSRRHLDLSCAPSLRRSAPHLSNKKLRFTCAKAARARRLGVNLPWKIMSIGTEAGPIGRNQQDLVLDVGCLMH